MKDKLIKLNEFIIQIEKKWSMQLHLLKEQFHTVYQSITSSNVIKNSFRHTDTLPVVKSNLLNNAIGIGIGFLSKKVLIGSSNKPQKRLIGLIVQFAVAHIFFNQYGGIQSITKNLYNRFLNYRIKSKKISKSNNLYIS